MKFLTFIYIFLFFFLWNKDGLTKNLFERNLKNKKLKTSSNSIFISSKFSNSKNKRKKNTLKASSSSNFIYHTVKKGETLFSIAKRYGLSIEELKELNQMETSYLKVGQKLLISKKSHFSKETKIAFQKKQEIEESENINSSFPKNENNFIYHTVKKGETLFSIAKRYGLSIEELKELNQMETSYLKVGQIIKIPYFNKFDLNKNFFYHSVQEGETLYQISLKYKVPIEEIKKINNLQENVILVGQLLKIPALEDLEEPFVLENPAAFYKEEEEETLTKKLKKMQLEREKKALKEKFLEIAKEYQNVKYRLGGNGNGYLDCSMFVKLIFQELGIELPRSSQEQFKIGKFVKKEELLPGDLVFFRTRGKNISHVGIYLGDNKFLHVSSRRNGLSIDSLEEKYYQSRYVGAKRILNLQ